MKLSKLIVAPVAAFAVILTSGCYYSDPYYGNNQYGGGGYTQGQQQGNPYGQQGQGQGYNQNQGQGYGYNQQGGNNYNQGNADYPDPTQAGYGSGGYTESGDVVTLPGDSYSGGGNTYSPPTSSSGRNYTVRKGDNLYRIGKAHGVSMQDIMRANGLSSSTIHPGQDLIIP